MRFPTTCGADASESGDAMPRVIQTPGPRLPEMMFRCASTSPPRTAPTPERTTPAPPVGPRADADRVGPDEISRDEHAARLGRRIRRPDHDAVPVEPVDGKTAHTHLARQNHQAVGARPGGGAVEFDGERVYYKRLRRRVERERVSDGRERRQRPDRVDGPRRVWRRRSGRRPPRRWRRASPGGANPARRRRSWSP